MKKLLLLIPLFLYGLSLQAQEKLEPNKLFKKCEKSVVSIGVGNAGGYVVIGSGIYLGNGYLVTNNHIREILEDNELKSKTIYFVKSGEKWLKLGEPICKIGGKTGLASFIDLAIYQVEFGLKPIKLSAKSVEKGQRVYTISSPKGVENVITQGLISNITYHPKNDNLPIEYMTDAAYTRGSSGGAVLNEFGELIGIIKSGDSTIDGARANLNYFIPVLYLQSMINSSNCNLKSRVISKSMKSKNTTTKKEIIIEPRGLEPNPGLPAVD